MSKVIPTLMPRLCRHLAAALVAIYLTPLASAQEPVAEAKPGVVLQVIPDGTALSDLPIGMFSPFYVTEWQRLDAIGEVIARWPVESAFHWTWLEIEQAPKGSIRLVGKRRGKEVFFDIPRGPWNIPVVPPIADVGAIQGWGFALLQIGSGDLDGAEKRLESVFPRAHQLGVPWAEPFGRLLLAMGALEHGEPQRAAELVDRVLLSHEDPYLRVYALELAAEQRLALDDRQSAAEFHRQALALRQTHWPEGLGEARSHQALADLAFEDGEVLEALQLARRALALRRQQAPGSLAEAQSLIQVGGLETLLERLIAAAPSIPLADLERAEGLFSRLAPDHCVLTVARVNLGAAHLQRGNFEQAAEVLDRAAAGRDPSCPQAAAIELNRAILAWRRGDLDAAEAHLESLRQSDTEGLWTIEGHFTRGLIAGQRGDYARAREHLLAGTEKVRQTSASPIYRLHGLLNLAALDLQLDQLDRSWKGLLEADRLAAELAPELPLSRAMVQGTMGRLWRVRALATEDLEQRKKHLHQARRYYRQSLDLLSGLATDHLDIVDIRLDLVNTELQLDCCQPGAPDTERRQALSRQVSEALAILERLAPDSLRHADALLTQSLVDLSLDQRPELLRVLDIQRRWAPNSDLEARTLYLLAELDRLAGEPQAARRYYAAAIEAQEQQERRLGISTEAYGRYRGSLMAPYQRAIENLIALDAVDEAFEMLERSRARAFLRHLQPGHQRPATSDATEGETAAKRRALQRRLDGIFRQIYQQTQTGPTLDRLLGQRTEVEAELEALQTIAPELPEQPVLDLPAIRRQLQEGTVILAYSVHPEDSFLFAVRHASIEVFPLGLGAKALGVRVAELLPLIGENPCHGRNNWGSFIDRSRRLYDLLITPVQAAVGAAERLLILPDGPLHSLPFAALAAAGVPGDEQFLVQQKPLHLALSASVHAALVQDRSDSGTPDSPSWVAFVNPVLPEGRAGRQVLGCDLFELGPLPHAEREVAAIARLFGPSRAKVLRGAAASEEQLRSGAAKADVLHFATHAAACRGGSLTATILLSPSAEGSADPQDGLLRAREILDRLRIEADLVVLSACETAAGEVLAGEGILGLSRAFQIAGASSVLASLWRVGDRETRRLMESFYGHWLGGMSRSEALRQAQLDHLQKCSSPRDWAAFQLYGRWR